MENSNSIEISGHIVKNLCYHSEQECEGWTEVQSRITGNDEYDGGATHEVVLKSNKGEFYQLTYTDWEIGNNGNGDDYEEKDEETDLAVANGRMMDAWLVYPKEVTVTIYERSA